MVCAAAMLNDATLVAVDRDMKQMKKRFGNPAQAGRYQKLNLIFLSCGGALAPKRVEHLMDFIEFEWAVACQKRARTMWLDIGTHYIRSYR